MKIIAYTYSTRENAIKSMELKKMRAYQHKGVELWGMLNEAFQPFPTVINHETL